MDAASILAQLTSVSPFVGLLGFIVWKIDQRFQKHKADTSSKEAVYQRKIDELNQEIKTSVSDLEKENLQNTLKLLAVIERFDEIDNTKHEQLINVLNAMKQELLLKLAEK